MVFFLKRKNCRDPGVGNSGSFPKQKDIAKTDKGDDGGQGGGDQTRRQRAHLRQCHEDLERREERDTAVVITWMLSRRGRGTGGTI